MLAALATQPAFEVEALIAKLTEDSAANHGSTVEQLRALAASGVELAAALHHAQIVAEKARMRRLLEVLTHILHDAYHSDDGCEAIIERARAKLDELHPGRKRRKSR
jgi:replicative DNA helicase